MSWETLLAYLILGVFFVFVLAPIIALTIKKSGDYLTFVKVGVSILLAAVLILDLIVVVFFAVEWAVSIIF
jgi:hypothetical protein